MSNTSDYGKSKIEKQNENLRKSMALLNETNEIGADTANQLKEHNEKIKSMKEKTTEINGQMDKSSSILSKMSSFWHRL
jgi:septation ring formation regulator EzrA